jgi:hypothetical protein
VGVLALAFIVYAGTASAQDDLRAGAFLLPLTLAFALQPASRDAWAGAATRRELALGTPVHQAVDRALGPLRGERMLTLARAWPRQSSQDLGFGNLPAVLGRASANGYDPLVSRRTREALPGMSEAGVLPGAFFRSAPSLLERLGIRLVQAPAEALTVPADAFGLGEVLDLPIEAGRPRVLPVPRAFATEVRLGTWMADAVGIPQGQAVARATVHLASGRALSFPLRAGLETAEWALDRADVRPLARHGRPRVLESFRAPGQDWDGHRYLAVLDLGGRYLVEGIRLERDPGAPSRLYLHRAGVADGPRATGLSLVSAYLSDAAVLREIPAVPGVRVYAVRGGFGLARVVDQVKVVPGRAELRAALRQEGAFDPRREAVLLAREAARASLGGPIAGARARRAEVTRLEGRRISLQAEGPGLVVLSATWDEGWTARVDGEGAPVLRVGEAQMGIALGPGPHRLSLRFEPLGFRAGLLLSGLAVLGLALGLVSSGRAPRWI